MEDNKVEQFDLVVVGAGISGSLIAYLMGKSGYKVKLLDRLEKMPPVFRAEKIEPDQAELFRKFGVLDLRRPNSGPIGSILQHRLGKTTVVDTVEQYGIRYHDTVNEVRALASSVSDFEVAKVKSISFEERKGCYELDIGRILTSKLVVLACGYNAGLYKSLGVDVTCNPDLISYSFGFDISLENPDDFKYKGYNDHIEKGSGGVDYITLFYIGEVLRVNLFTQLDKKDPRAKQLIKEPAETINQWFPDLRKNVGEFSVVSRVEQFITQYKRIVPPSTPGLVICGDTYQSVSPTTGTGLTKVLNEVDVLCGEYLPRWIQNQGASVAEVSSYYNHAQKRLADEQSLGLWRHYQKSLFRRRLEKAIAFLICYDKLKANSVIKKMINIVRN